MDEISKTDLEEIIKNIEEYIYRHGTFKKSIELTEKNY